LPLLLMVSQRKTDGDALMRVLTSYTDVYDRFWKVIFVFDGPVPDWCWHESCDGEILCFGGHDNAIGWGE
jgi:hypothetical protein